MAFSDELVISVSAAAIAISKCLSNDEMVLLGSVLTQLGDTLNTIASSQEGTFPQQPDGPAHFG